MKTLAVVIPCLKEDEPRVGRLIREWVQPCRHHAFLVFSGDYPKPLIEQAEQVFAKVHTVHSTRHFDAWPRNRNELWQAAARAMVNSPCVGWLYWEPDAQPLKATWLDELCTAYVRARLPFMGTTDAHGNFHATAVYPNNVWDYCTKPLLAKANPFEDYFRDELRGKVVKQTNLIVRHHALYNKSGVGRQGHCHVDDVQRHVKTSPDAVLYCGVAEKKVSPIGNTFHRATVAPLYTISVLCLNNWDLTKKCLDSILAHSADFELIVTNNGSTDETAQNLSPYAKLPNVRVITNAENKGFQEPNEEALKMARGRFFVLFNNDMEACPGWLEGLRAPFESDPKMALTGIAKTCCRINDQFNGVGGDDSQPEYIEGGCLMAPAALLREHGMFSPYLSFIYWEDTDLGLRMRELGYHIATVALNISHNHRSATTRTLNLDAIKKRNLEAMWERWAFYIKRRTFERRVQVIRRGARGDVLLVTPALEALRKKWPQAKIHVQTAHPEMLAGVANCEPLEEEADHVFNLDSAYEREPRAKISEVFARACGVVLETQRPVMVESGHDQAWAKAVARHKPVALVHAGPTTWPGKNWPEERFREVVAWLQKKGCFTIAVGAEDSPPCGCDDSVAGLTTPQQLYALAKQSKLFFGLDSMPQHVASAANLRSVLLFGATDPACIVRDDLPALVVQASRKEADCVGAHGRRTQAETFSACNGACMRAISVGKVIDQITKSKFLI